MPRKTRPSMNVSTRHSTRPLFLPRLRAPDAHRHGEAGGDQYRGVERAPEDVELVRCLNKRRVIPVAENQVGAEQAPEEHDFRQQEQPHGEAGGVHLLLHALEMMALVRRMFVRRVRARCCHGAIRHWLPLSLSAPAIRSRRRRDPRWESQGSSPSAGETESATPGPSPATDSTRRSRRTSATRSDTGWEAGTRCRGWLRRRWRRR